MAIVLLVAFLALNLTHRVCRLCPCPAGGGLRARGTASLLLKSRSLSSLRPHLEEELGTTEEEVEAAVYVSAEAARVVAGVEVEAAEPWAEERL